MYDSSCERFSVQFVKSGELACRGIKLKSCVKRRITERKVKLRVKC